MLLVRLFPFPAPRGRPARQEGPEFLTVAKGLALAVADPLDQPGKPLAASIPAAIDPYEVAVQDFTRGRVQQEPMMAADALRIGYGLHAWMRNLPRSQGVSHSHSRSSHATWGVTPT